jgi:hypothetical protein
VQYIAERGQVQDVLAGSDAMIDANGIKVERIQAGRFPWHNAFAESRYGRHRTGVLILVTVRSWCL